MKKLLALVLCAALALTLAACTITIKKPANSAEASTQSAAKTETTTNAALTDTVTDPATTGTATDNEQPERYRYEGISLLLPEGFTMQTQSGTVLVLPPDYPTSADNITLVSSPNTAPASSFTQELLEQAIKQQYAAISPQAEIESELFERTTVAGFEAVHYQIKTTLSGVEMHQEMLILFPEGKQITVTFTKVTGKYDDAFAAVAASIQAD